jgi:hypothetical protein
VAAARGVGDCGVEFGGGGVEGCVGACGAQVVGGDARCFVGWCRGDAWWWGKGRVVGFAEAEEG